MGWTAGALLTLQSGQATLAVESASARPLGSVWWLLPENSSKWYGKRPSSGKIAHQKAYDGTEHPDRQDCREDEIYIQVSKESRQANFTELHWTCTFVCSFS